VVANPILVVEGDVLGATFAALRSCGGGRAECIVYWTGPTSVPTVVDAVVQPHHSAGPTWYEITSDWITEFFLDLRRSRRCVRAQVHTHPGGNVEHSLIDDSFPIAPSTGLVSIVLPHFATRRVTLAGAHLAVQGNDGEWVVASPEEAIQWR
jgi:hypothetical protein